MAQIYLVRHTKVDIGAGICYGASDIPLASNFPVEAQIVIEQLKGVTFDAIYSSPLSRCKQLADLLATSSYTTDLRLTELNFGEWEGKTWDSIYQTLYGKKWMDNYMELSCPGGESYKEFYNRVAGFINEEVLVNSIKNVLIITHAGVIRLFLAIIKGIPSEKLFNFKIDFGEVIKIENG